MKHRNGLSMLEVLIALVVLGLVVAFFAQASHITQRTTGRAVDWIQEGTVIEKTVENLRVGHTLDRLRTFDSSWTDHSGQVAIQVTARGAVPDPAAFGDVPTSNLALMTISARRTAYKDSVVVTTVMWVP
ncbi:MAG TPA: prepilin-type N-terminal cleavage/methylation domain-containing protein [Fibrobacteria bacterium]|nr:prepilin-type N-terminal cleavage/methylation domain-containing protein [Fibrobacteria bacterium]